LQGFHKKFSRKKSIPKNKTMINEETKQWLSKRFSIPTEDIIWYNSGVCYNRIGVKTQESAWKVSESVKDKYVNGGMLDGAPLGGYTKCDGGYDVMC